MPYDEPWIRCPRCTHPIALTPSQAADEDATVECIACGTVHPARKTYFQFVKQRLEQKPPGNGGGTARKRDPF